MKRLTCIAALACVVVLGSTAVSRATVLVSETFAYPNGSLNGQNGGTGFNGGWTASNANVTNDVVTGGDPAFRNFASPFPSSGTLWLSFDWGNASQPQENGSYGGLTFYVGGSEKFLIGNTWPTTGHGFWRMSGSDSTGVQNYPGLKTGVAKITLGAGATSSVELWVGPTGSPVDVSGPAMATSTGGELAGVDRIRILGGNFGSGGDQSFDNLVIGTSMTDVAAVPEPSVAILGGLGGLGMLALLRRRRIQALVASEPTGC